METGVGGIGKWNGKHSDVVNGTETDVAAFVSGTETAVSLDLTTEALAELLSVTFALSLSPLPGLSPLPILVPTDSIKVAPSLGPQSFPLDCI